MSEEIIKVKVEKLYMKDKSRVSGEDIYLINNEDGDGNVEQKDVSKKLDARRLGRNSSTSLLQRPNNKIVVPSRYLNVSNRSCHDKCKSGHNTSEMILKKPEMKTTLLRTLSDGKGLMKKSMIRRLSFRDKESEKHLMKVNCGMRMDRLNENQTEVDCDKKPHEIAKKVIEDEKKPMKNVASVIGRIRQNLSSSSHQHPKNLQSNCRQEAKAKQPEAMPEKTLYMVEHNGMRKPAASLHSKRMKKPKGRVHIGTKEESKTSQNASLDSNLANKKGEPKETELVHPKHIDNVSSDCKVKLRTREVKPSTSKSEPGSPKGKEIKLKHNECEKSHLNKSRSEELRETESVTSTQSDSISRESEFETPIAKQNIQLKANVQRAGKGQAVEDVGSDSTGMMRFRRGQAIDFASGNNSPVKLEFKSPRILNNNEDFKSNASKVSYKRRESGGGGEETRDGSTESENVTLKHQEAEGKKDNDVDVNNVIEETVSKLVKTRKSKVKALVGAFETVISLKYQKVVKAIGTS